MLYSKTTIENFTNPEFAGEIKHPSGVGQEGNMKCGDVMKIFIKVEDDVITDIKFQTYGCIAAIASTNVLCKLVKGKHIDEALNIKPKDVSEELGKLPTIKVHCSIMGHEALQHAIDDYKQKRAAEN